MVGYDLAPKTIKTVTAKALPALLHPDREVLDPTAGQTVTTTEPEEPIAYVSFIQINSQTVNIISGNSYSTVGRDVYARETRLR